MPRYDASGYDPPAPVAIVSLRRFTGDGSVGDVPLQIDTGADVTLLPRSAVTRLGVTPVPGTRYELIGFDGSRSAADAVELDMLFLNKSFRGRYLLTDNDHGILGRDVLASIRIALDGPAQAWSDLTVVP